MKCLSVCVLFANHLTIVALHANLFCIKVSKLLVHIFLIKLCLQYITGVALLAPMDRSHADFADSRFINMQLLLKKVFVDKFSAKNQPGSRGLRKSRDSNSPMMRLKPKLSHNLSHH